MILTGNAAFIGADQSTGLTEFQFQVTQLQSGLVQATAMANNLQQYSNASMLQLTLLIESGFTQRFSLPHGTVKRCLVVYCESEPDVLQNRSYQYKIRVVDPDPAMLVVDQTRLDPLSARGAAFIAQFLTQTTDVHGNAFARVIGSEVVQFV